MALRIIVVDDSIVFRTVVAEALRRIPDVEVVATAMNGEVALKRIEEFHPDLITLDIEMPGMSGLDVLDELRNRRETCGVIVISSFTVEGSATTITALEKGAFDFIAKPAQGADGNENRRRVFEDLMPRVKAFARSREIRGTLKSAVASSPLTIDKPVRAAVPPTAPLPVSGGARLILPELLIIGVSTGGPVALGKLLPMLPGDFPLPILIVQHMPPLFTAALAESLGKKSAIRVTEAAADDIPRPGTAYIAPGGRHMKLVKLADKKTPLLQITDEPPENNCRPAVDYLFRSVSHVSPGRSIALILTGMGSDGTLGLRLLKRGGCHVIAQDETSCVVYGMPKAAVDAGVVDEILPLDRIADRVTAIVRKSAL